MQMSIENRGTQDTPFGFVYAGLHPAHGYERRAYFAVADGELRIGGPGSGYWKAFSPAQLQQAAVLLAERFGFELVS